MDDCGRIGACNRKKVTTKGWRWLRKLRGYIENALLFSAVLFVSTSDAALYSSNGIDLFTLYILLMGLFHGTKQSFPAALAATGFVFFENMNAGRFWGSIITDPDILFKASIYLFIGLVIGFIRDKYKRELKEQRTELKLEQQKYEFLMNVYNDTRNVKDTLQKQVLTSRDSLGRLHTILGELESLEPDRVVMMAVNVLEDLLDTKQLSIYAVNNDSNYLRLMAKSSDPEFDVPRSLNINSSPEIAEVIRTGAIYANKDLIPNAPMLAAAVIHEGQTSAVICVHDLPFGHFTLYHENLFRIASDLVSRSLSRSFKYVAATRSERYIDDTSIMQEHVFKEVIESKKAAKNRNQTDFILLAVQIGNSRMEDIACSLSNTLRSTDYIGLLGGELTMLLSSTGKGDAELAIDRLEKSGIIARLLQEEEAYA